MAIDLPQERVSRWVGASGWILLTGVVVFLGAYIYEQTYLTWLLGPSDLPSAGSLLTMPLFLFGLVTTILSHLWLIAVLGVSFWRKQIPGTITWLAAGLLAITLPLAYLPFNVWDWLAVEILGPGLHAADYLSRAAGTGDERLVRALLSQGMDVNRYDSNGTTALHAAAGGRQEHMVQFLIRHKADVLARRDYCAETPLMDAAVAEHLAIVKFLLARGADLKQKNCDGDTAGDLTKDQAVANILSPTGVVTR